MSEFDNISSVEKWVMQRKINMNTTCLLQDDISIKEFLQINKNHKFNEKKIIYSVENTRMQINHGMILLYFLYKITYHMDAYQLEKKCLGTSFGLTSSQAQNLHHDAAFIMNHCIACNIYTATHKSARENLEKMTATHTTFKKHTAKKKSETFWNNLKHFAKECESLFHIKTRDKNREKSQEKLWNIKQTSLEKEFYHDRCKIPKVNNS